MSGAWRRCGNLTARATSFLKNFCRRHATLMRRSGITDRAKRANAALKARLISNGSGVNLAGELAVGMMSACRSPFTSGRMSSSSAACATGFTHRRWPKAGCQLFRSAIAIPHPLTRTAPFPSTTRFRIWRRRFIAWRLSRAPIPPWPATVWCSSNLISHKDKRLPGCRDRFQRFPKI